MAEATRMKTGKGARVKYEKQDSDDDAQTDDVQTTTPKVETTPAAKAKSPQDPESDDDYGILQSKKRKPSKSSSSTSKAKKKGKAKAQLDTLFDKLPTDVVYMIFSHLHPLDLLRLARTNRMLRSHLMSKSSASVWREAREEVDPPVPDCPPDQSEPQWAQLLFSRYCSTCMRTNIPKVDWLHRLRLCSRCDRAGVVLIIGPKARKAFPHFPDVNMLLDLLPHSNTGSSSTGKYYRIKDIQDIGTEWGMINSDAEIQEFKNRRKSETEEIMTHGTFCKTWDRDRSILTRTQNREAKLARRNEIFARLEALGHNPQDVRDWAVVQSRFLHTSTPLTERKWATIRPGLEALVIRAQERRLQRDRDRIIRQRETIAESVIKSYLATSAISPAFHPRLRNLVDSESFQAIISQPNEVAVIAVSFQPALDTLPDQLAKAAKAIQSHLLHRMVSGGAAHVDPSITDSAFDKIGLATSTFFCQKDYYALPVCSKDDLNSHKCSGFFTSPDRYQCLSYDHRGSSVVAPLLAAANLNPNTTADEMDEMDLRFYCPGWLDQSTPSAINWRDAAYNARRSGKLRSSTWKVFSPEDTAAIKRKEMANNGDVRNRFGCNICAHPVWIRREELERHLRGWHSIVDLPDPTTEFHLHPRIPPLPVTFYPSENSSTQMTIAPSGDSS